MKSEFALNTRVDETKHFVLFRNRSGFCLMMNTTHRVRLGISYERPKAPRAWYQFLAYITVDTGTWYRELSAGKSWMMPRLRDRLLLHMGQIPP